MFDLPFNREQALDRCVPLDPEYSFIVRVSLFLLVLAGILNASAHESPPANPTWQQASPWPDRIVATFETDPATSFAVSWRTADGIEQPKARITEALSAPRFDRSAREHVAETERVRLDSTFYEGREHLLNYPLNPDKVQFHSVNFTGLEPNTLYAYQVCGAQAHCSEWFHIRTAPRAGEPIRFIYLGDAQNGVMTHFARVIRAAWSSLPDAHFILHAGDLVDHASRDLEWASWFRSGGFIHAMTPVIPVTGNHEYDKLEIEDEQRRVALSSIWRPQFRLPVVESLPALLHETVYTVTFGATLKVLVLNTQFARYSGRYADQAEWLDSELANSAAEWNIVAMHHPIFSAAGERDNEGLRAAILPVLRRHNVPLVLQGHDHTYSRGQDHQNPTIKQDTSGTVFVTSVSGAKMYSLKESRWDGYNDQGAVLERAGENTQFYQLLEIDDKRLDYRSFTATGERYDAFSLLHRGDDGFEIIQESNPGPERKHENTEAYGDIEDLNPGSVLEDPAVPKERKKP